MTAGGRNPRAGRPHDAFVPIVSPQAVADKGWGELQREMDDPPRGVPASIVERIEWREGDYDAELRGHCLNGKDAAPERVGRLRQPAHRCSPAPGESRRAWRKRYNGPYAKR